MTTRSVVLPAAIGAAAGVAYTQAYTGPKLDARSFAIGGAAAGLGVAQLTGEATDAGALAFGASLLLLVAYDRWHDRMWPFA